MRYILPILTVMAMAGCSSDTVQVSRSDGPELYTPSGNAPPNAKPGTCWDKTESPALVQSVTEDVLVQPAQISSTGTIQAPPVYRSQTRQVIVRERQVSWIHIPCDSDLTPEFVASLQRALSLRGYYSGPVTGTFDAASREAIARFQTQANVNTISPDRLTVEGARKLGLWTVAVS